MRDTGPVSENTVFQKTQRQWIITISGLIMDMDDRSSKLTVQMSNPSLWFYE
jgi:hypothetical protein